MILTTNLTILFNIPNLLDRITGKNCNFALVTGINNNHHHENT